MSKMFLLPLLLSVATSPINATLPDVNSLMQSSMRSVLRLVPFNGQIAIDDQIFTFGDPNAVRTPLPQPPAQQEVPSQVAQGEPQLQNLPQEPSQPIGQNSGLTSPLESPQALNPMAPLPINFGLSAPLESPQAPNPIAPMPTNFGSPSQVPQTANPLPPFSTNFGSLIPNFGQVPSSVPASSSSLPNIESTEVGSTFAQNSRSNFNDEFSQTQNPPSTPAPFAFPRSSEPQSVAPTTRNQAESPLVVMPMIVSPDRLLQSENSENPTTTPLPGLATGSTIPIPALFASTNNNDRSDSENKNSTPIILTQLDGNTKNDEPEKRNEEVGESSSPLPTPVPAPLPTPLPSSLSTPLEGRQLSNDSLLSEPSVRDTPQLPPLQSNANTNEEPEQRKQESIIPFPFEPTLFDPNPKIPTLAELDAQMERKRTENIMRPMNGLTVNKK